MAHKVHNPYKAWSLMTIDFFARDSRKEPRPMKNLLLRLWNEEEGQDLTEYALLLVLLTLAAIGSLSTLASAVNGVFSTASTKLQTT